MSKLLVNSPKPPFQLYRKKGRKFETTLTKSGAEVWACGECGTLYTSRGGEDVPKQRAQECCLKRYCSCGNEIEKYYTGSECSGCQRNSSHLRKILRAEEITAYDGPVYDESSGRYWSDVEEFLDWAATEEREDLPEWIHPCTTRAFGKLDARDLLESSLDEHHEDAYDHVVDIDGLQHFLTQWCEKQTLESWEPDCSKKISVEKLVAADKHDVA